MPELVIDCKTCKRKGTDFYFGLYPRTNAEAEKIPQNENRCFYYVDEKTGISIEEQVRELFEKGNKDDK